MPKQNQNYFSFLLRAWRDHEDAEWRFSIQSASDEKRFNFSTINGLIAFLHDLFPRKKNQGGSMKKSNRSDP